MILMHYVGVKLNFDRVLKMRSNEVAERDSQARALHRTMYIFLKITPVKTIQQLAAFFSKGPLKIKIFLSTQEVSNQDDMLRINS